jgi:tetratricopeptide (TPR) repeat protein
LDTIASHIFITYQNFYKKGTDVPSKILFKLPLVNISKKASIFLDSILDEQDVSRLQIFMTVILLPDYFPDDRIEIFDNLIQNMSMEYIETKSEILEKYSNQINEKFIIEQKVKDAEIVVEDDYLIETAIHDFEAGLEQYKNREFDRSYFLLRKAHMKFELENELKLLLETTYFIATILMLKNKFIAAKDYFQKLEALAEQLEHQKYHEKSIFMEGYCDYQEGDYNSAYKNFTKLAKTQMKFISIFQYCMLLGKVLADVGYFNDAIKSLEKALEISASPKASTEIQKKRAEIYLDLGHIYYEGIYQAIKSGNVDPKATKLSLNNSIKNFEDAIKIWKAMDNYAGLIEGYKLIANNYEVLGEVENAIKSYEIALEFAELSNDMANRFKLLEIIIQLYAEQNSHEEIVKKIDIILHQIAPVAYLDLFSVAGFHNRLGESFIELDNNNEALSELLVALNLYHKFSETVPELVTVYNNIIAVYQKKEEQDRVEYYRSKLNIVKEDLEEIAKREKIKHKSLEVVEEFWLFSNEGVEIFSYTPKSNTNPRLLSGFLIAMDNFGTELKLDQIKTLKIGLEQFVYYKEEELPVFMVGRASIKFQFDLIEKVIKIIYKNFLATYEKFLENFDGDTSKFEPFIKDVKVLDID